MDFAPVGGKVATNGSENVCQRTDDATRAPSSRKRICLFVNCHAPIVPMDWRLARSSSRAVGHRFGPMVRPGTCPPFRIAIRRITLGPRVRGNDEPANNTGSPIFAGTTTTSDATGPYLAKKRGSLAAAPLIDALNQTLTAAARCNDGRSCRRRTTGSACRSYPSAYR